MHSICIQDWFLTIFTIHSEKIFGRKIVKCWEAYDKEMDRKYCFKCEDGEVIEIILSRYQMNTPELRRFLVNSVRDKIFSKLPRNDRLIREQNFSKTFLSAFKGGK